MCNQSQYRRPYLLLATVCAAFLVSACQTKVQKQQPSASDAASQTAQEQALANSSSANPRPGRQSIQIPGSGQMVRGREVQGVAGPINAPGAEMRPSAGGGYQLNFSDTEISTVVSSVLGDGLNVPYVVDPQVKGTMSLFATRPLSRDELLSSLEAALRIQGAALLENNGVFNVLPIKDATRRVTGLRLPSDSQRPGFAVQIVPLQFVSVTDMEKILRPFANDGAVLRSDEARNLLVLAGTSQELTTMMEVVRTFDADWLAGMSFGLFALEYSDAKVVADELAQIFSDAKSPIGSVVRIIPLARLNSLMIATQQPAYLSKVESWIRQLDIGTATPGRRLYVYDVQNGKAGDLAQSLNRILALSTEAFSSSTSSSDSRRSTSRSSSDLGSSNRQLSASSVGSTGSTSVNTLGATTGGTSGGAFASSGTGTGASDANSMRLVPNDETNTLLIFATPSEFSTIETALKRLDVRPVQVLIEASLAEVSLNDDLRFGLQWAYDSSRGPLVLSEAASGAVSQSFPGFSYLYTGRQDIQGVLNTLESITKVKVISSPKLLVLNNHEASLQVGDQVPVATQSSVSTVGDNSPIVNSVEMRDTGVILRITPRVNKSGAVLLDIGQEVSDVVRTTTSSINSPTIQQRKLNSTVVVHDGETIALGGLIRESKSTSRSGLPLLSRIPFLGSLFGTTSNNANRTELVVLITPRVVRSAEESESVMDDLRQDFRALRKMIPEWRQAEKEAKRQSEAPSRTPQPDARPASPSGVADPAAVNRTDNNPAKSANPANPPAPTSAEGLRMEVGATGIPGDRIMTPPSDAAKEASRLESDTPR